jgi:hypothetical protein
MDVVALRWWGFERDTIGPDGAVQCGAYWRLVEHLREKGGEVRLGEKVTGLRLDERGSEFLRVRFGGFGGWRARRHHVRVPLTAE